MKRVFTFDTFGDVIHQRRERGTYGCIGSLSGKDKLVKSIQIRNNEKGFVVRSRCVDEDIIPNGVGESRKLWFFTVKDFHAFSIQRGNLIDIREKTLKQLDIKSE